MSRTKAFFVTLALLISIPLAVYRFVRGDKK